VTLLANDFLAELMNTVNEMLSVLWIHIWINTMTEIGYIVLAAEFIEHLFSYAGYILFARIQSTWVQIALKSN
jgi:hypothetical protein